MLKRLPFCLRMALVLVGFLFHYAVLPAQDTEPSILSKSEIQNRLNAIERSTTLADTIKNMILERYRQALSDVDLVEGYENAIAELKKEQANAPAQIDRINKELTRRRRYSSNQEPDVPSRSNEEELESLYGTILVARRSAESSLDAINKQLEEEFGKPASLREKMISLRAFQDELESDGALAQNALREPLAKEALEISNTARAAALAGEIELLDQQLVGNRVQIQLLRAKRDNASFTLQQIEARLKVVGAFWKEARSKIYEEVQLTCEAILEQDSTPVIITQLASDNLDLIELYQQQLMWYDSVLDRQNHFKPMVEQLDRVYENTKQRLDLEQSSAPLGRVIREEREEFPTSNYFSSQRRLINQGLSKVGLRLINADAVRSELLDKDGFLTSRMEAARMDTIVPEQRALFSELVEQYEKLVDQTITNDLALERNLHTLDETLLQLKEQTQNYDQFLDERLLWVRSAVPIKWEDWKEVPHSFNAFTDPVKWQTAINTLKRGINENPLKLVWILLALLMLFSRRLIYRALVNTSKNVGKINKDHIIYTIEGILFTILLALPIPLILWTLSDLLTDETTGDLFTQGLSRGLWRSGSMLFYLLAIRGIFLTGGVADKHLRWNESRLHETRRVLGRYTAWGVPFLFLTIVILNSDPGSYGGVLGLSFFALYTITLLYLGVAFIHPKRGLMRYFYESRKDTFWWRWRWVWLLIVVVAPAALSLLAWMGFLHTTADLYFRIQRTVWLITIIWLLSALVRRSMLILRRKLMYEAVKKKQESERRAELESQGSDEEATVVPIEPHTDEIEKVSDMDNDTRQLFNASMLVLALVGLTTIWDDVFPALKVLNSISIWSQTVLVDGVESVYTISLANLLVAIVIGILAFILAKNLPSLINILLLKQGSSGSGTRYAASTLLQYTIITVGVLAVLRSLGVTGAQLGWLAAALGVGIGFGLQEIVANFISGIIVLFEQPVRVGDVVTIGGSTGVVSRIHIRATTIRDWENKELLVPNRELITGKVLNWTLSDTITRVEIKVGITYGSDVQKALDILIGTAKENPRIMEQPAPFVHFEQFGDSSLSLTLRAFVSQMGDRLASVTEMNKVIDQRFKEEGITIAYPQVDIHVKNEAVEKGFEIGN